MFKLSHVGQTDSAMQTALKGTSGYYAPEYVRTFEITRKIDVYAFGVVLFEILCRQSPWVREDDESYYVKDDEDLAGWAIENVDLDIEEEISRDCLEVFTDVIGSCLQQDSSKRLTMDDVVLDLDKALRIQEQEDEKRLQVSMGQFTGFRRKTPSMIVQETREEHEHVNTLVFDIGGALTKVGFSGYDTPHYVSGTGVAYDSNTNTIERLDIPFEDGIIPDDWNEYDNIFLFLLKYKPEYDPTAQYPVLLTRPPLKHDATSEQRKREMIFRWNLIQQLFEGFGVPAVYVALQPVLSLYANGHTTGIVVESGEGVSYSVPIYEGHALPHAITSLNLAGYDLTNHFMKTLNFKSSYKIGSDIIRTEHELMREVKEKLAYVAIDYNQELLKDSASDKVKYELPDGKFIALGTERFKLPEALFSPSMLGLDEAQGIQKNTFNSITMCDPDIRNQLFGNIVLSGGTTMLSGFANRMTKEMKLLAPKRSLVKIWAPEDRNHGAWVGGSVLASLSTFKNMWITREEFEEYGPGIVRRKCF